LSKITYHWFLSLDLFRLCEIYLLHIKLFVGNQSAIAPFLGGYSEDKVSATHCNTLQHTATHCNTLQHTTTHCNALQHSLQHTSHTSQQYSKDKVNPKTNQLLRETVECCDEDLCNPPITPPPLLSPTTSPLPLPTPTDFFFLSLSLSLHTPSYFFLST